MTDKEILNHVHRELLAGRVHQEVIDFIELEWTKRDGSFPREQAVTAIVMASERLADEEDYETEIAPQLQGAIDYITKGVK